MFYRKLTYCVNLPIDKVQYKLRFLTNRRFDDYSVDVIGRLQSDGSFSLTNKWAWIRTRRVEDKAAYIKGFLRQQDNETLIEMRIRPNRVLVCAFYLMLVLAGLELARLEHIIPLPWKIKVTTTIVLCLLLLAAMILSTNGLKKRFERLMELK